MLKLKEQSWISSPHLVLPGICALVIFFLIPALATVFISLTDWTIGSQQPLHFIGLQNYSSLFGDPNFIKSINNTLYLTVLVVPASFFIALLLALAVHSSGVLASVWQTIYFLPATASLVAMGVVWEYLLHPTLGLLTHILRFFGNSAEINWLNDPDLVLITIAIISIWQSVGYYMLVFLSGLLQIPQALYEAARMDGAGCWQRFVNVTWPLLGSTSVFVFVITVIRTFQTFDLVKALTNGGPNKASEILLFTMYQEGFSFFRSGISAAIATMYLIVMTALTIWVVRSIDHRIHYGY